MRHFRLSPDLARRGLCAAPDFARVNMAQCVLRETVERTPWLEARRG